MIDCKAVSAAYRPIDVIRALELQGEERGHRFFARNPTRDDRSIGSFYIDLNTGYWVDKSTGDWGQDSVSLWAYCRGTKQGTAAAELRDAMAGREVSQFDRPKPAPRDRGELVMPAVVNAEHRMKLAIARWPGPDLPPDPTVIYEYLAVDGIRVLGLVYRWDLPDGKKTIRQRFQFRTSAGVIGWQWAGPTGDDPRPLYRLERLSPRPRIVWIVEGEKTADAAQALAPGGVSVLSWLGGADSAGKVSLDLLRGHECVLLPDRDAQRDREGKLLPYASQPGVAAMLKIAAGLHAIGCRVSIVDYVPGQSPHGWDLADAAAEGWTMEQVQEMIDTNIRPLPALKSDKTPREDGFGTLDLYLPLKIEPIHKSTKNTPLNAWQNFAYMFHCYGITCRDNQMTQKTEICHVKTDRQLTKEEVISLCAFNSFPIGNIRDHLRVLSMRDGYHPVTEWIKARPWDGRSRMADVFGSITLGDSDPVLSAKLFFRWCIGAVAMATQERRDVTGAPPAAQGVLVLVGSQDLNKSRWISSLAPAEFVRPGVIIDIDDKDSVIKSTTAWLVEWAELTGSKSHAKIARIKAHITGSVEFIRKPYAEEAIERSRRTVYIGTENNDDYLTDSTGNRRWWTIRVRGLNVEHGVDMQQFWAEVYHAFLAGAPWWLVDEEKTMLAESNRKHEVPCGIQDLLHGGLKWDDPARSWETATSLMQQLGHRCQAGEQRRVIAYLEARGCVIERDGKHPTRVFAPLARVLR